MAIFTDTLAFITLLFFAGKGLINVIKTSRPRSIDLLSMIIFIAYGIPITLKYLYNLDYDYRFEDYLGSNATRIRCNIILIIGVSILNFSARSNKNFSHQLFALPSINYTYMQLFAYISWFFLLLPLLLILIFSHNRSAYLTYGNTLVREIFDNRYEAFIYFLVGYAVRFSFGAYFLIRIASYNITNKMWTLPTFIATNLMLINCYLEGKRSILGLFIITIGFLHILQGGKKRFLFAGIAIITVLFGVYNIFGKAEENESKGISSLIYGDFGRLYTLHYAAYHSNLSSNDITPRRGNTFLWVPQAYIPRKILSNKIWNTSQIFTAHIHNRDTEDYVRDLRWTYGIGYFEEFLLNFGYLGLFLFIPLGWWCKFVDKLIYNRSFIYIILWGPLVYNVLFGFNASLRSYVTQVIPILFIGTLIFNKRPTENLYNQDNIHYGDYNEFN